MVRTVEVVAGSGSPVVVKRATGADVASLRAEARRLEAAAHPGVVQLLTSSGTDEQWELCLAYAGRAVSVAGALTVPELAAIAAAVAATLADLHESGIVHGRIDASHVLIGRHGRPVLCGVGPEAVGATPADDVAALGVLLAALLGSGADMEPIPERRWLPGRSWSGWERRSLLLIADQACADPPTRRPTARRLAAAIAQAVPGALTEPTPTTPDERLPASDPMELLRSTASADVSRTPPRLSTLAGALVGVALLAVAALRVMPSNTPGGADRPASATAEASPSTAELAPSTPLDLPPTTTTSVPVAPVPCVVPSGAATASDGCVEPVTVDGTKVVVGTRRFDVGRPGDLVVLGDWDCDGGATPAVLRPSTGEVFVFSTWAGNEEVVVRPTVRVANAATPHVEAGAGTCAILVVRRADGSQVAVPTERSA